MLSWRCSPGRLVVEELPEGVVLLLAVKAGELLEESVLVSGGEHVQQRLGVARGGGRLKIHLYHPSLYRQVFTHLYASRL